MQTAQNSSGFQPDLPPELNFQPAPDVLGGSPPKSNNRKQLIMIAAAGTIIVAAAAVVLYLRQPEIIEPVNDSAPEVQEFIAATRQYPDEYVGANLPQYPNSNVVNSGRKDASLADGLIHFSIYSNDSAEQITSFFDEQLTAAGWPKQSEQTNDDGSLQKTYQKDQLNLSLTFAKSPNSELGVNVVVVGLDQSE